MMQYNSKTILSNYAKVKKEIAEARDMFHLPTGAEAELIAVTKTHSKEAILPLLEAGHRVFGENRVQEAKEKWPELQERFSNVRLHLIGPLQSNKTKEAVALFDTIHTVDREKLARALKKEMEAQNAKPNLFVQVNTGEEPQKAGLPPKEVDDFIALCNRELELGVTGLMCIPPVAEEAAPHFALLRTLAERNGLANISMGMSSDYALAAGMGATHVRVGSALFGARAKAA